MTNPVVLAVCVPLPDVKPLIRGLSRPLLASGEPDPVDAEEEAEPDELGSVVEDDGVVVPGEDVGVVVPGEDGKIGVGGVGGVAPVELEPVELGDELDCTWPQLGLVVLLTAEVCAV